jgi:hypothetical protein
VAFLVKRWIEASVGQTQVSGTMMQGRATGQPSMQYMYKQKIHCGCKDSLPCVSVPPLHHSPATAGRTSAVEWVLREPGERMAVLDALCRRPPLQTFTVYC